MSLLPIAAALLASAPAPNAVTPDGPATLRASWLGASPSIHYGPRVVVRWRVTVGEGGAAGPVVLRVLSGSTFGGPATATGRGPVEQLPAAPGVYEFPAQLRFLDGDLLAIDQQTGGHAIVTRYEDTDTSPWVDPYELNAVDVWRPVLGDGETRAHQERLQGERLQVTADLENDMDGDGYGDRTQDENDLAIAASAGRRAVRVVLRNRGDRPVQMPHVLVRMQGARLLTPSQGPWLRSERAYRVVRLQRAIPPGKSRSVILRASRRGFRVKLVAGSVGFDPTRASVVVRGR